jgi:hypothetical protein
MAAKLMIRKKLTHRNTKQTYHNLNTRDPHESFESPGIHDPVICAPCETEAGDSQLV